MLGTNVVHASAFVLPTAQGAFEIIALHFVDGVNAQASGTSPVRVHSAAIGTVESISRNPRSLIRGTGLSSSSPWRNAFHHVRSGKIFGMTSKCSICQLFFANDTAPVTLCILGCFSIDKKNQLLRVASWSIDFGARFLQVHPAKSFPFRTRETRCPREIVNALLYCVRGILG